MILRLQRRMFRKQAKVNEESFELNVDLTNRPPAPEGPNIVERKGKEKPYHNRNLVLRLPS